MIFFKKGMCFDNDIRLFVELWDYLIIPNATLIYKRAHGIDNNIISI